MSDNLTELLQMSVEIERARRRHPSGQEKSMIAQTLTAADRCDACDAAAVYRVTGRTRLIVLDYCAHHWRKHKLAMPGWQVTDVNKDLLEKAG